MTYCYHKVEVLPRTSCEGGPTLSEKELDEYGKKGWRLVAIEPKVIQTAVDIETRYTYIFEERIK